VSGQILCASLVLILGSHPAKVQQNKILNLAPRLSLLVPYFIWPISLATLHVAHLRQECHNSKFGIFELLVWKQTFAGAFLTGVVS